MTVDRLIHALGLAAASLALASAAAAQPVSYRDSFPVGSTGGLLCTAQAMVTDPALSNMFDRGYSIVCRDAAVPVGQVYALRTRDSDPLVRLAALRSDRAVCEAASAATIEGLGALDTLSCRLTAGDVSYLVYVRQDGDTVYVAEGLAGYDSALQLALRSVVADRVVDGPLSIATTGAGDAAAFARAQAGSLDPQRALALAYRRNNAGSYAESAEFFAQLTSRDQGPAARAEALVNEGLQKSNLGHYAEAEALFARAASLAGSEPVTARRLRNYRAMHLLNQGLTDQAMAELERPMPGPPPAGGVSELVIDRPTAAQLSAESPGARRLSGQAGLTAEDKAQILDGQAMQLRGTILRLTGRDAEAVQPLTKALDQLVAIREGRIAATLWMRAQIYGELAAIAEDGGDVARAEQLHLAAVEVLQTEYPGSAALLTSKGRLAGFYARTGQADQSAVLFREIVTALADGGQSSPTLRRLLEPWFALLAARGSEPQAVADLFAAGQALVRPGVAQTQAILARELSGGSDEASRLFRQSVDLTRDIERARVGLARLEALESRTAAQEEQVATLRTMIARLQQDQVATQAQLAAFPRYRVIARNVITLPELQALLGPDEAYYKMIAAGDAAYAIFVTPDSARAFRLDVSPEQLDSEVDELRSTIIVVENGQNLTYPFDVELAWTLYRQLFGPIDAQLAGVRHLVFEPDGAMLRLPPNLLVSDRASVDAYQARVAANFENEFDFRGIAWLGRERDVSTAVSARAFRDVRTAPASTASAEYIGFGDNAPVSAYYQPAAAVSGFDLDRDACSWPLSAWNRPVPGDELITARRAIVSGVGGEADVVTGAAFSDTAIKQRENLDEYRVLHFATHGLLGGPRAQCASQPALLTSFGGPQSDGLLTFSEIFDLDLDADLIILSACDTAGRGSQAASEAAGVSGGDTSLDGLVRAFVGAGSRNVVGSHWPVPIDFGATEDLISGLFTAPPGTGTAAALRAAQRTLMDRAETSHPYYWSGFAVIGDGAVPVIRTSAAAAGAGN